MIDEATNAAKERYDEIERDIERETNNLLLVPRNSAADVVLKNQQILSLLDKVDNIQISGGGGGSAQGKIEEEKVQTARRSSIKKGGKVKRPVFDYDDMAIDDKEIKMVAKLKQIGKKSMESEQQLSSQVSPARKDKNNGLVQGMLKSLSSSKRRRSSMMQKSNRDNNYLRVPAEMQKAFAEGFGDCPFDSAMHMQSSKNLIIPQVKVWSYCNYPITQVVSGLKDPNKIIVVSLQTLNRLTDHSIQNMKEDALKTVGDAVKVQQQQQSEEANNGQSNVNQEEMNDLRRKAQDKLEKSNFYDIVDAQRISSDKKIECELQWLHVNDDNEQNEDKYHQITANKKSGNSLIPYKRVYQKYDEDNIEGEWELLIQYEGRQYEIMIDLTDRGTVTQINLKDLFEVQGDYKSNHNEFVLVIDSFKKDSYRQDMQVNEDYDEIYYCNFQDPHEKCKILRFVKIFNQAQNKNIRMIGHFGIWEFKDNQLKQKKVYHLNDPLILSNIYSGSPINCVIHTTEDGEAYLMYEEVVNNQPSAVNKDSVEKKITKIGVLDQSWPDNQTKLPLNESLNDRLNHIDKLKKDSRINMFLKEKQLTPCQELGNQVQFFNNFKTLVQTKQNLCQAIDTTAGFIHFSETKIDDYACLMVLAIDSLQQYAYILCKKNTQQKILSPQKKRKLFQVKNQLPSSTTRASVAIKLQQRMGYSLIKYHLRSRCKEEIFQIEAEEEYIDLLIYAEDTNSRIEPHFDEESDIFLLKLTPLNCILALKMNGIQESLEKELFSAQQARTATLHQITQEGETLVLVKQVDRLIRASSRSSRQSNQSRTKNLTNQTEGGVFYSVGKPMKIEKKDFGMVKSSIDLIKVLQLSKALLDKDSPFNSEAEKKDLKESLTLKHDINIDNQYYINQQLDHTASLTQEQFLLFGAMTQIQGSKLHNLHISAEEKQTQQASKNPIFTEVQKIEYPFFVYRDNNLYQKIILCNMIEPNQPQTILNLGQKHKLRNFVEGGYLISRYQTRMLDTNILMLIEHDDYPEDMWLMVLNMNVFAEDRNRRNLTYMVSGSVPLPIEYRSARIHKADLFMQINNHDHKKMFEYTVIIQLQDCVMACFMQQTSNLKYVRTQRGNKNYKKLNQRQMGTIRMLRDYNQNLYYVEQDSGRAEIINISADPIKIIRRQVIYSLEGLTVLALEIENSNQQNDCFKEVKRSLFIFDSQHKVHHLQKDPQNESFSSQIYSLEQHELQSIKIKPWGSLPINKKSLIIDGQNYSFKTSLKWESDNHNEVKEKWQHENTIIDINSQIQFQLFVNYSQGSRYILNKPAVSTVKAQFPHSLNEFVEQMIFVGNDLILVNLIEYDNSNRYENQCSYYLAVFNIRNGTLVSRLEAFQIKIDELIKIECCDFSNMDQSNQQIVVIRKTKNQTQNSFFVLQFAEDGQYKIFKTIAEENKGILTPESFPMQGFKRKINLGSENDQQLIYPGNLFLRDIEPQQLVRDNSINKLFNLNGDHKIDRKHIFIKASSFKGRFVAAELKIRRYQDGYAVYDQNATATLKIKAGNEPQNMQLLSTYIIKPHDPQLFMSHLEYVVIPANKARWLSFHLKSTQNGMIVHLRRVIPFYENSSLPQEIKDYMIQTEEHHAQNMKIWQKQVWKLNPNWFRDIKTFCLPKNQNLPPMILYKEKLIVIISEIDLDELPLIQWINLPHSQSKLPLGLITLHEKEKDSQWSFINLIAYQKNSNLKRNLNDKKKSLFPRKATVIGKTIYLYNIGDQISQVQKIIVSRKESQDVQKEGDCCQWDVDYFQTCSEFSGINISEPVSISRLSHSWVPKLRPSSKDQATFQNYKDVLQVNIEEQAFLFSLDQNGAKANNFKAQEIDQIDSIDQMIDNVDNFVPFGFKPTYFKSNEMTRQVFKKTVLMNGSQDLYFVMIEKIDMDTQETFQKFEGPYQMHSESDLEYLFHLKNQVNYQPTIDYESVSRIYNGHSIFSIFFDNETVLDYLVNDIYAKFFKNKKSGQNEKQQKITRGVKNNNMQSQNSKITRKLFQLIIAPVNREQTEVSFFNQYISPQSAKKSLIKLTYGNSRKEEEFWRKRELLLKIVSNSKDFSLDHCIDCIDDMIELIFNDSPISRGVIQKAFKTTKQTKQIKQLNWNKSKELFEAFQMRSSLVTSEQVTEKTSTNTKETTVKMVRLDMLSLRWMLQDGNRFCDMVAKFKELGRDSWFGDTLLAALFRSHWPKTRWIIIKRGLLPFSLYFITSLIFTVGYASVTVDTVGTGLNETFVFAVGIPNVLGWIYFTFYEISSMKGAWTEASIKLKNQRGHCCERFLACTKYHYSRYWNFVDTYIILSIPLILTTGILSVYEIIELNPQFVFWTAFLNQSAMWLKLFDWLRLFQSTAIFPIILVEVFKDTLPFFFVMFMIMGFAGNGTYVFSAMVVEQGQETLFRNWVQSPILSSLVFNELLTMTGEPDLEQLESSRNFLFTIFLWLWLMLTIMMTQIVFVNVLIAMMKSTFDRVWEYNQTYVISSQADILCDWLQVIKDNDSSKTTKLFMYVVRPSTTGNDYSDSRNKWQGKIAQVKKLLVSLFLEAQQSSRHVNNTLMQKYEDKLTTQAIHRSEFVVMNNELNIMLTNLKEKSQNEFVGGEEAIKSRINELKARFDKQIQHNNQVFQLVKDHLLGNQQPRDDFSVLQQDSNTPKAKIQQSHHHDNHSEKNYQIICQDVEEFSVDNISNSNSRSQFSKMTFGEL